MTTINKAEVINTYQILLQDKIDVYQDLITSLTQDAQNDAKSSAGDKHETTLSKLHIEQEKIAHKLHEAKTQLQILHSINPDIVTTKITLGSLVFTNHLVVLMCCAFPKITIHKQNVFGISPEAPLGKMLLGKSKGDVFEYNTTSYEILEIL
jgi:Transcription elongation factor, GreA/GreB, C-term